jgi:hypothetical protein
VSETVQEFREGVAEIKGLGQEMRQYFSPAEFENTTLRDLLVVLGVKIPNRWKQTAADCVAEAELHISLLGEMGRLRRLIAENRSELKDRVKVDLSKLNRALVDCIVTTSEAADDSAGVIMRAAVRQTEGWICDMVNADVTIKRETVDGVPCIMFHPPADKAKLQDLVAGGAA